MENIDFHGIIPEGLLLSVTNMSLEHNQDQGTPLRVLFVGRAAIIEDCSPLLLYLSDMGIELRFFEWDLPEDQRIKTLDDELASYPPEVLITFEQDVTVALSVTQRAELLCAPIVAFVSTIVLEDWNNGHADRFLTIDDETALLLADSGIPEERILSIGTLFPKIFEDVELMSRKNAKINAEIPDKRTVLIVTSEMTPAILKELLFQLSVLDVCIVFETKGDDETHKILSQFMSYLNMEYYVDSALLWRAADVVITRSSNWVTSYCVALGTKMIVLDSAANPRLSEGLVNRQLGLTIEEPRMVSAAIKHLDRFPEVMCDQRSLRGTQIAAEVIIAVAWDRKNIVEENIYVAS